MLWLRGRDLLQEYDGLEDAMQRFARTDIGSGPAPEDAVGRCSAMMNHSEQSQIRCGHVQKAALRMKSRGTERSLATHT